MKYAPDKQTVSAVYDNNGSRNPLIEAFPERIPMAEFWERISNFPPVPIECADLTITERMRNMAQLQSVFIPLSYHYYVYDTLYRLIQSSYYTRASRENVARINAFFIEGTDMSAYGVQPQAGAMLGVAGIGKTNTLKKCLSLFPSVIFHERYLDKPFFCNQVLWLFCECPADGSLKSMAINILSEIDRKTGSNHLDFMLRMRSTATSSVISFVKSVCRNQNVGALFVDEVQSLVIKARQGNRIKDLIRFLTELTNDTMAIYLSGTLLAESVFTAEEHLRRRTRGPRLLPFKPDGVYRDFLQQLWPYQYTARKAVLTDKLANMIFDYTGGITAYITKIFEEAQVQAIMDGADMIDDRYIQAAVKYLSIKPPREYEQGGNFISDFKVGSPVHTEATETIEVNVSELPLKIRPTTTNSISHTLKHAPSNSSSPEKRIFYFSLLHIYYISCNVCKVCKV